MLTHMMQQISKHALIDINLKVSGDTETGSHHVVEDTAIVLGEAFDKALVTGLELRGWLIQLSL